MRMRMFLRTKFVHVKTFICEVKYEKTRVKYDNRNEETNSQGI